MNVEPNKFKTSSRNKRLWVPMKKSALLIRWLPLIAMEVYLNATILVFALCSWPLDNPAILYSYVIMVHLLLALGYALGVRMVPRNSNFFVLGIGWRQMLIIGILITLATSPLVIYSTTGGSLDILTAFSNPGDTYLDSRYRSLGGLGVNFLTYYVGPTRVLFGFFVMLVVPVGLLYWKRLSSWLKIGVVGAAAAHILESTSQGSNKGFADIIVILPWLLIMKDGNPIVYNFKWKRLIMLLGLGFIAFLIFFFYFNSNISERINSSGKVVFLDMNGDHIVTLEPFPSEKLNEISGPLIGYCTQGYYALACSLELPFVWTYGVGNSSLTRVYVEKYLTGQGSIFNQTYVSRTQTAYHWDEYERWHTIYPWLAGDFTFVGVLIIVFWLGMVLAMTWRDAIEMRDYLAANLFILLIIAVCYFPANNQLMQVPETALGFYVALVVWWWGRSRGWRNTKG